MAQAAVDGGLGGVERTRTTNQRVLAPYAIVTLAFVAMVLLTVPVSLGDTTMFTTSVAARLDGRNFFFWDFGHVLWRPAATIATGAIREVTLWQDPFEAALRTMVGINFIAGLGSCLLLLGTLRRLHVGQLPATATTIAFLLTHGVLSYTQTGTAYLPGMLFLMASLYLAVRAARSEHFDVLALGAGVSGAIAAGLWFPYVFAIPSAAIAAGWLEKNPGVRAVVMVLAGAAVTGLTIFVGIALAIGMRTPAEFIVWMGNSGHDISGIGGVPRMALGFGRSLVHIGDDGSVLRRFLDGDPHNPVSLGGVVMTRVWLLGMIWLMGLAVIWQSIRERRMAILAVFAAVAVPVFTFAVLWQGGDVARYFPLYPGLFVLLGVFLSEPDGGRGLRFAVVLGLVIMAVNNVAGLSILEANERRGEVRLRLANLIDRAGEDDVLYTSHSLDEVTRYGTTHPLEPLIDGKRFQHRSLVLFGTPEIEAWRQAFAGRVQRTWADGRQVWIASRLLQPVPRAEWRWIESSDPRVAWGDFSEFFSQFEFTDPRDADGFLQLRPTPANRRLIDSHAE